MQSDNGWSTVASCSQIPWQIQVCSKILNVYCYSFKINRLSGEETPCHIMDLYKFTDNTGILELHKRMLAQPFMDHEVWLMIVLYWCTKKTLLFKVDLKILYYELIRMLVNYEREQSRDQELYEYTRSITKIEGYQVSNKIPFCIF